MVTAATKLKDTSSLEKKLWATDSILKSRDISLLTKVCLVKAMLFAVVMYGCENQTTKKAEHWTIDAFELWCWRTLESPLDCKVIKPVNPKGNHSWIFIGRTDAEAEAPILWPNAGKSQLIYDTGKNWRQEEKGTTEGMIIIWHFWFSRHKFEEAPGDCEGQGSLVFCSSWGHKDAHATWQLNNKGYKRLTSADFLISSLFFCHSLKDSWRCLKLSNFSIINFQNKLFYYRNAH